jgi:hypothetical protein
MSKMGSHDPFGHLKHKLWPKERSGVNDAPQSSLLDRKMDPIMLKSESSWNLVPLPASSTKGGWEGRAESSGIRLGRGTTI